MNSLKYYVYFLNPYLDQDTDPSVNKNNPTAKTKAMKPKYSIIIPTYNHCDDYLKPLIESIAAHTDMSLVELIIVANGCTDNTREYVRSLPYSGTQLVWVSEPLGYTKATNMGMHQATSDYLVLMNNDLVLLPQTKNKWLEMLVAPFETDPRAGITGPVKFDWECGANTFEGMAFWLVMVSRSVVDSIGYLDEIFSPGMGEDGDYCIRAVRAGFTLVSVPEDIKGHFDNGIKNFGFPIYHVGNGTFADDNEAKNAIIERNNAILADKYGRKVDVSIIIPTYNHFEDALYPCLTAVSRYTNFNTVEVIVSANGCTDQTRVYLEAIAGKYIKFVWEDQPTGVVKAYNKGIKEAAGKYIVLLDNDSFLLEQPVNQWLYILKAPFLADPKVGASSPFANDYPGIGLLLHSGCTMYDAELLRQVGMFDEAYNPGYFCDPDVAAKIWEAGRSCVEVPEYNPNKAYENGVFKVNFPVCHMGDVQTMNKHKDIEIVKRNRELLYTRHANKSVTGLSDTQDTKSTPVSLPTNQEKNPVKYTIVIPTYNHCDDLLKPCIESIFKYTDMSNVEIVVVANGCTDSTRDYLTSLMQQTDHVRMVWIDEAAGYTRSTNEGIKVAKGEFLVLLNNDTELLPQSINQWLNMLEAPFNAVPTESAPGGAGITGPLMLFDNYSNSNVLIFFCVMIKSKVLAEIGDLDEIYSPGGGEDIDLSIRAQQAGYGIVEVTPQSYVPESGTNVGGFPIFHKDNKTFGLIPEYTNVIVKRNGLLNCLRYNKDIKLNLGSGGITYPGFLSVDLYDPRSHIPMDIANLSLFPNDSVSELMASHVFEHLPPLKAREILKEWLRVLKPGGTLAMEMPDIEALCKSFVNASTGERYGILNAIYGSVNTTNIGGPDNITSPHVFGYYPSLLKSLMLEAGFRDITFHDEKWPHPENNFRVEARK